MSARAPMMFVASLLMAASCAPLPMGPAYSPQGRHGDGPAARSRPDAPDLRKLPNGRYRVRRDWTVELDGRRWVVPKGYQSNGITGPAHVRKALGDGVGYPETWAAMFHDWLFTQPGISRAEADRLFRELLLAYGVPREKARVMYSAVAAYSMSRSVR